MSCKVSYSGAQDLARSHSPKQQFFPLRGDCSHLFLLRPKWSRISRTRVAKERLKDQPISLSARTHQSHSLTVTCQQQQSGCSFQIFLEFRRKSKQIKDAPGSALGTKQKQLACQIAFAPNTTSRSEIRLPCKDFWRNSTIDTISLGASP